MSQKFLDLAGLTAYDAKIKGWVKSGTVDITNDEINALFAPQIEFVDLGLSVKWAKSLLGATNGDTAESWYGNYYAWGELTPKTYYDWTDPNDSTQNYKYANGSSTTLTKYCNNSEYGNVDNLTKLVPGDDVATVTNSAWRMPTQADFEELIALPSEWATDYSGISGLNGRLFIGTNGNTLFIPAAGYRYGSDISNAGSCCNLWSSSLFLSSPKYAYLLYFNSDYFNMDFNNRCHGYSVCPVC